MEDGNERTFINVRYFKIKNLLKNVNFEILNNFTFLVVFMSTGK